MILHFLANSGRFCDRGATLRRRNPLLSPDNFTWGDLMKIKWFVVNVTAVGFPDGAEHAILGVILAVRFWPIQTVFAVGEPLSDVGTAS